MLNRVLIPETKRQKYTKLGINKVINGYPRWLSGKESTCNAEDVGLICRSGRSPEKGNGNPLQDFCLKKSHGQRSLEGYSPKGYKELNMTQHEHEKVTESENCSCQNRFLNALL